MNTPKKNFLDRIEQSFILIKWNFLNIWISYIIFSIVSSLALYTITTLIISTALAFAWMDKELWLNTNLYIKLAYFAIVYTLVIISFVIIKIPFLTSLIKNINETYNWINFNYMDNLKYWFKNIWNMFRVYWYIFKYILLLPSLILILWLTIFLWDKMIWWFIILASIIIWTYFMIIRWLKSYFSLNYAITTNDYTEENFKKSLSLSSNKLLRIFWNSIWIAIIIALVAWIISKILLVFSTWWTDYQQIFDMISNKENWWLTKEKIDALIEQFKPNVASTISWFIQNFWNSIIEWISFIFLTTFQIFFMKRLQIEKNIVDEKNDENIENDKLFI